MNKKLVINASPIILLGKADLLKTISPLARTWIILIGDWMIGDWMIGDWMIGDWMIGDWMIGN